MNFSSSDIVAIASTAIAALSFLFNFLVVRKQTEMQTRQTAMQLEGLRMQLDNWIVGWTNSALDDISHAIGLVDQGGLQTEAALEELNSLKWRLSSRIDQGRIFFPNVATQQYTSSAESGENQGYRRPVLDAVAFVYFLLNDSGASALDKAHVIKFMRDCRALLYTEVQKTIDPTARERVLGRIENNKEISAKLQNRLARDLE